MGGEVGEVVVELACAPDFRAQQSIERREKLDIDGISTSCVLCIPASFEAEEDAAEGADA